jgi:hypothetical protein
VRKRVLMEHVDVPRSRVCDCETIQASTAEGVRLEDKLGNPLSKRFYEGRFADCGEEMARNTLYRKKKKTTE